VKNFLNRVRKVTRFTLALFLWLHALFFLNLTPLQISRISRFLHLTTAEVLLFLLLLTFSFVAGSSFWKGILNLLYIYFFPFILLFYSLRIAFHGAAFVLSWFSPKPKMTSLPNLPQLPNTNESISALSTEATNSRRTLSSVWQVVSRPLRRFTLLWCFLLLVSTHSAILWFALIVVLIQLSRTILKIIRMTVFSGTLFGTVVEGIRKHLEDQLTKLGGVTKESAPNSELKNLWMSIRGFETIVKFLQDQALVSRWTSFIVSTVVGCIYLYIAFVFSFVYFAVAHMSGDSSSWHELFVTSLFIPFLITDLPRIAALKMLAGVHGALIVTVGLGTFVQYLRKRMESVSTIATVINVWLSDQVVRERFTILNEKFANENVTTKAQAGSLPTSQTPL